MSASDPQIHHQLTLDFRLTGFGWAEFEVSAGGTSITLTVSYLSDALGQLAAAALLLKMGAPCARVSFVEEPGSYRCGLDWHRPLNGYYCPRMRIWYSDKLYDHDAVDQGELLFDELIDTSTFFCAIQNLLNAVLIRYGEDGYRKQWHSHPFPIGVMMHLNRFGP